MSDKSRILIPVTILNTASLSGEVNVNDLQIIGIRMPAGWTAAGISFRALIDDPSPLPKAPVYGNVVDSAGAEITITNAAAGTYIAIASTLALWALGRILVRSGTNAVPVAQGADRNFWLVCVPRAG